MPEAVQYWRCEFCKRRKAQRKSVTVKHESTCYKNPGRVPYVGELTYIGQTGSVQGYGYDASIEGNWYEWQEKDVMPAWWPGEAGMIWDGERWHQVPGYEQTPPRPGHGCAGGAPYEEEWPEIDGTPLYLMPSARRLQILESSPLETR